MTPLPASSVRNPKTIALWTAQVAVALFFGMAAFNKFSGHPMMVTLFKQIGVGQWFRYATGLLELAAAVLLVTPRYCGVGALLLLPTMIGAILTHLLLIGGRPLVPAMVFLVAGTIAYLRRDQLERLVAHFKSRAAG